MRQPTTFRHENITIKPIVKILMKILPSRARLHNLSVIISKLKFHIKKFWMNIKQSNTGVTNAAISKVRLVINAE